MLTTREHKRIFWLFCGALFIGIFTVDAFAQQSRSQRSSASRNYRGQHGSWLETAAKQNSEESSGVGSWNAKGYFAIDLSQETLEQLSKTESLEQIRAIIDKTNQKRAKVMSVQMPLLSGATSEMSLGMETPRVIGTTTGRSGRVYNMDSVDVGNIVSVTPMSSGDDLIAELSFSASFVEESDKLLSAKDDEDLFAGQIVQIEITSPLKIRPGKLVKQNFATGNRTLFVGLMVEANE